MGYEYKVLGQSAPSATTEDDLYTVPALSEAVISTVLVCNRAATADTFRISVAVTGGTTATKDYLYYDVVIPANDTFAATIGITLEATDELKVYAGTANLSFSAFGSEVIAGGGGPVALDDLSDVIVSSPIEGDLLTHDGTTWSNLQPFSTGIWDIEETNYETLAIDSPRLIRVEGGDLNDPATLTIPPNSSVAFPIGTTFWIQAFYIDYKPKLIEGAGVTLQGWTLMGQSTGDFEWGGDGEMVMLVKTQTDTWDLMFFNYTIPAWS